MKNNYTDEYVEKEIVRVREWMQNTHSHAEWENLMRDLGFMYFRCSETMSAPCWAVLQEARMKRIHLK